MGGTGVQLRDYARAVGRRLWLVFLLGALVAAGVYWRTTSEPPRYSASASLLVTSTALLTAPNTSTSTSSGGSSSSKPDPSLFNTAIQLLLSRPMMERVAERTGLQPSVVKSSLTAQRPNGTNLLRITATAKRPETAQKIANASAEEFIAYFREANRRDYQSIRVYIGRQLTAAEAALNASDRKILAYHQRYGIADIDQAISAAMSELASTRSDVETTRLRLKEDDAKIWAAIQRLQKEKLTRVTSQEVERNPVFETLQSTLTNLEVQRAALSQRYTDRHPKMQELAGQIADVKARLARESRTVLGREQTSVNPIYDQLLTEITTLQVDRAAALSRLQALRYTEEARRKALLALPGIERGLATLMRENETLSSAYSTLAERHQDALLREQEAAFVPAGVQVAERAALPGRSTASLPIRVGFGALVGVVLGLMAVVLLEGSDDKIRSAQDAERTLGAPVLAQVPDMTPQRVGVGVTLVLALLLTFILGGSLVLARTTNGGAPANGAMSAIVRLGQGIDSLAARVR